MISRHMASACVPINRHQMRQEELAVRLLGDTHLGKEQVILSYSQVATGHSVLNEELRRDDRKWLSICHIRKVNNAAAAICIFHLHDAARQGAPDALQVADRFHLLVNLRGAVQRLLERHRTCLPTESQITSLPAAAPGEVATRYDLHQQAYQSEPAPPRKADVIHGRAKRAIRLAHFEQVREFASQGMSIRAIARTLRMARQTVQKFVQADTFPERAPGWKPVRGSILDPFVPYLLTRWRQGCYNVATVS